MGRAETSGVGVHGAPPAKRNGLGGTASKRPAETEISTTEKNEWKRPKLADKTDKTRWRMRDDEGRHTWHYLEDDDAAKDWPLSSADEWYLGLPMNLPALPTPKKPMDAVQNGLDFFEKLQLPPGNWGCEYGGPMFLLPGFVIAWYVTKTPIPWAHATEMKNYVIAHARKDGGWGLHIEGESSVFGTALNYTALRILGMDADHPVMIKARGTLHRLGGAVKAPHWGKFWLAVLGVVPWDIVNPVPPELWMLPDWVPFAPWRWWIHIRMVFLPMSYIYSKRWQAEVTDLVRELRQELFVEPYEKIDWGANRDAIAASDNYHPKSWLLNTANWVLANVWNPILRPNFIKQRAEDRVGKLIDMEDENTDYSDLAPVNNPLNMIYCHIHHGPDSYQVRRHRERLEEFLWVNDKGMMVNGTNGVQCWDTAFAIQTVMDAGLTQDPRWRPMLVKALEFLDSQQTRENPKWMKESYRHRTKGAWGFSNRDQGYAVSDCVSEALKSVIILQKTPGYPQLISDRRIFDAVDTLLTYQTPNGGCASYEPPRGSEKLEVLNAAEVFGRIMVEYLYPECTTACVTALSLFHKHWPDYRAAEVKTFVDKAVNWIKKDQRPDGSWYGSWGICFTYAGMFALESLASIGETYGNSAHAKKGCDFLVSKQREDGGWSESYKACEEAKYIEHPMGSLVVQTSWAVIGLMKADYPHVEPIRKAIKLIMERQQPNGEWLQEAIEGVFNKSCMISYPNYKFTFTLKALGMFAKKYPDETVV